MRGALDKARGHGVVNKNGEGVVGLIDVGSVGPLPRPWHQRCELVSHVLKFEPRDASDEKPHVVTIDAALWSSPATLPFYVYRGAAGQGSSLYQQNVEYVRENFETLRNIGPAHFADTWFERAHLDHIEEIECTTLDAVLKERPETYHVLKIDARGAERQILEGARDYLSSGNCVALHLELFKLPLYIGISLRPDVEDFVDSFGFSLVKEYPAHGSFDSQNDCIFLRRGASGPVADAIRDAYGLS